MNFIPDGETGTSIMVLGPAASRVEETVYDVVGQIADAALWWAWPHMVPDATTGLTTIDFSFSQDGVRLMPPDPGNHDVLRHYVDAYRRADELVADRKLPEGWPWTDKRLRSGHGGKNRLGVLFYRRLLPQEVVQPAEFEPAASHHVALMRAPRMIVKYLEAPRDARGLGTAGVFIAEPSLNGEFALSEPVAHDDWVPANIGREKFQRNNVKQALEALRRELRPSTTDGVPSGEGSRSGASSRSLTGSVASSKATGLAVTPGSPVSPAATGAEEPEVPRAGSLEPPAGPVSRVVAVLVATEGRMAAQVRVPPAEWRVLAGAGRG